MKIHTVITLFSIYAFFAFAEQSEHAASRCTSYQPLGLKPETTIHVTPSDADRFWQQNIPPEIKDDPIELHEFKKANAHLFWIEYVDKKITVSGEHHCTCCFSAAIGAVRRGFSDGWALRIDEYISIGVPNLSTAYTEDGKRIETDKKSKGIQENVWVVGTIDGPHDITESLGESILTGETSQAVAYFFLKQKQEREDIQQSPAPY